MEHLNGDLTAEKRIVNKFGAGIIGTVKTSIWSGTTGSSAVTGLKPLPPITGEKLYISSDSTDDADQGTGAWQIILDGLDRDFLPIREIITLDGQNQVESLYVYTRVCRAYVESGNDQAGNIFIGTSGATAGVPAVFYSKISKDGATTADNLPKNQTQQACFTIPAGYYADFFDYRVSRTAEQGSPDDCWLYIETKHADSDIWRIRTNMTMTAGTAFQGRYNENTVGRLDEKIDLEFVGKAESSTAVTADFDIRLVRFKDVAASMYGELTISNLTETGFTVSWDDVENTGFSDGFEITIGERKYSVTKGVTSFTVDGLVTGQEYNVSVKNTFRQAESNALSTTVTPKLVLFTIGSVQTAGGTTPVDSAYLLSDDDGESWSSETALSSYVMKWVTAIDNKVVATFDDPTGVANSQMGITSDGINWTYDTSGDFTELSQVGSLLLRKKDTTIESSTDGVIWTATSGLPYITMFGGTQVGSSYVMLTASGQFVSTDGINWSEMTNQASFNNDFGSSSGTRVLLATISGGTTMQYEYTDDLGATAWIAGGSSTITGTNITVSGNTYHTGKFWQFCVEADYSAAYFESSDDGGVTWSSESIPGGYLILGMRPIGNLLYVSLADLLNDDAYIAVHDGTSWSSPVKVIDGEGTLAQYIFQFGGN